MRPISVTVGPLASAGDTKICLSQTTAGAADLTLNGALVSGGVATLDTPRRVLITCGGNDSGITYTVYGTNAKGFSISEVVTGVSGTTTYTAQDFATVTRIATSGATSGSGVKVGTNGIASSWPICFNLYGPSTISLQADVTGTVNYTVQQTLLDFTKADIGWVNAAWESHPDTALVGATGTAQGNYAYMPYACRVLLNSGTGSVKLTAIQAGTLRG